MTIKTTAYAGGRQIKSAISNKIEALTVPLRTLEPEQVMTLGFRQNMLEIEDRGSVATGAGLGTDFILLQWGKQYALVRGSELLKAWVKTFAPKDAARFPNTVKGLPQR